MSENHTYVESSEIIAKEDEIEQLKTGNTAEMRKAEERVKQKMRDMKVSGEKMKKRLSKERQQMLSRVHAAMETLVESAQKAGQNATVVQENVNAVNKAIIEASNAIGTMVEDEKARMENAEQLYIEAVQKFTSTEACVEYQRFARETQASIKERIAKISTHEVAASAMQLMTTTIITDIYQMDISVAREQAVFDAQWAESSSLLEKIIAQCNSAKSENYAEVGDSSTELLDINYWSGGRFNDLMTELEELRTRLTNGYNDAMYDNTALKADLERIHELDKAKDIIIANARMVYNQSKMREAQGLAAMDILIDNHEFSLIGKGFEGNDRREAFILRMKRHTDNAEIEVIVTPTKKDNEFSMYFRLDTTTYADESVIETITKSLAADFKDAGLKIETNSHCTAEQLEPFNPGNPTIADRTRRLHNMPSPVRMQNSARTH